MCPDIVLSELADLTERGTGFGNMVEDSRSPLTPCFEPKLLPVASDKPDNSNTESTLKPKEKLANAKRFLDCGSGGRGGAVPVLNSNLHQAGTERGSCVLLSHGDRVSCLVDGTQQLAAAVQGSDLRVQEVRSTEVILQLRGFGEDRLHLNDKEMLDGIAKNLTRGAYLGWYDIKQDG